MSGWRYIATRIMGDGTEPRLDAELELSDVDLIDDLSGYGGINAVIAPEIARLKTPQGEPVFQPWGTGLYAEKDGQIRGGGIVTGIVEDGPELRLDAVGHAGYPEGMPYDGVLSEINVDPLDMARHIWDYLQGFEGGNLGMVLDGTRSPVRIGVPSGPVNRDEATASNWAELKAMGWTGRADDTTERLYPPGYTDEQSDTASNEIYKLSYWNTRNLGEEFNDLATRGSFDYRVEHYWAGDQIKHRMVLGYPRLGARKEQLRFFVGENVFTAPEVDYDGSTYASEVIVLGAGEGRKMIRGTASRERTGRLRRVAVVERKQIRSRAEANATAERQVQLRAGEHDIDTVIVTDHPNARLGSYDVGDEILVRNAVGWTGQLELWVRIISITIEPEGDRAVLTVARAEKVT